MTSKARTKDIIDPGIYIYICPCIRRSRDLLSPLSEYPLLETQRSKIKSIEQDTFEYATKPSRVVHASVFRAGHC